MRTCEVDNCNNFVFGTDKLTRTGYCKNHQTLRTDISHESIMQRAIKKQRQNAVKLDSTKVRKIAIEVKPPKDYAVLDRWYKDRRKELDGHCHHCKGVSCKDSDKYYKFSICHILPKAYFPSVVTHPSNFVELCFWNKNCHGNMDNKMLDLIEMNCWDEIVTKFCIMYPSIAENEKRRIPPILIEYLKT